jgi:hypothetical protein
LGSISDYAVIGIVFIIKVAALLFTIIGLVPKLYDGTKAIDKGG